MKPTSILRRRVPASAAALAIAGTAAATMLTGCANKFTEPYNDAPRSGVVNTQPADVIAMPDGFNNLATKCDHGNRIYVSYHNDKAYAAVAVVAKDPTCPQK